MNTSLRMRAVDLAIRIWMRRAYFRLRRRLRHYRASQEALAVEFGVSQVQPTPYDPAIRKNILELAEGSAEPYSFAWTSGTTNEPKRLFYPKRRNRIMQRVIVEQGLMAYDYLHLRRPAFYLLTSMLPDRSFSSLFLRKSLPSFISDYVLRDSIVYVPEAEALTDEYSEQSIHLALLLLCEPTLLLTVNPSSLYVLLEAAELDWERIRSELQQILGGDLRVALRRRMGQQVDLRAGRATSLLKDSNPPTPSQLLPQLRVIVCWDSGYVRPFLDNLRARFAEHPPHFYPLFSLSTETVAYLLYPKVSPDGGLPIYPGVCYEFIPASAPGKILKPWELDAGGSYEMVVSDVYGLLRYRTEDLFECVGFERDTPLLKFLRRAGQIYSFTGEKLTDQQLLIAYDRIREAHQLEGALFTCFPKLNKGGLPGYVIVGCLSDRNETKSDSWAREFDQLLSEINSEYASKRISGRLAAPELVFERYDRVQSAILASSPRFQFTNPAQFKLLPLYKVHWEELALPTLERSLS